MLMQQCEQNHRDCRSALTHRCTLENTLLAQHMYTLLAHSGEKSHRGKAGTELTHSGADLAGRDLQGRWDALCYQQRCTLLTPIHPNSIPILASAKLRHCKYFSWYLSTLPTASCEGNVSPLPLCHKDIFYSESLKLVGLVPTGSINTDVVCLFSIFLSVGACGKSWWVYMSRGKVKPVGKSCDE